MEFGRGFPCLKAIFLMEIFLGDSFGPTEKGFGVEGVLGVCRGLRAKFGQ